MNTPDDSLTAILRGWRVKPPADPDFRPRVWRRIEARARPSWPAYLRSHAGAWSLVALLVVCAAAFTGQATARARVRTDRETLVATYLVGLDPRVQAERKP
ncbi:MAG TPA: hypothetical protein VG936_17655 [Lacunisphaera sp.]|nr:hypothetical protein [Lacunisphaera sp.]